MCFTRLNPIVCVVPPPQMSEDMRIRKEYRHRAEQDLSLLLLHYYPVYPVQLRSPLTEDGRLGDRGEGEGTNV